MVLAVRRWNWITMARKRDNDSFDTLADEFARRMRRGESPEIEDYVARCSEDADDVRDLFLAIAAMENAAARLEPTTLSYEDVRHRSASARFTGTDRYRILGVLGTGGMGTVYEAYDLQLQVRVALKLLPSRRPDDLIRFKQEFRSLTELSHPSLVSLYEFFSGTRPNSLLSAGGRDRYPAPAWSTSLRREVRERHGSSGWECGSSRFWADINSV